MKTIVLSTILFLSGLQAAFAVTNTSLIQQKIDDNQHNIDILEQEIKEYQKQIDALGSQATTLAQALKSLELSKKKLEANIRLTENRISAKNREINDLSGQISTKQNTIEDDRRYVLSAYSALNQMAGYNFAELLLGSRSISDAITSTDQIAALEANLYKKIKSLQNDKVILEKNKSTTEQAKKELQVLQSTLNNEKKVVLSAAEEKNKLLKETNQSEASYRKIMAQKQALKDALEQEIQNYESQLHLNVNSSDLPSTGSHILSWPLDTKFITQYFGNTDFATANPQVYNGKGHTGIDLRASIGTQVKASLGGQVVGMGNTDIYPRCYSYGKWVMIRHPNGLSTLYAHLSLQTVKKGDSVDTGQVIGYSGNTGYSTGPHLHFGVYATEGVQIKLFDTSKNCKGATIPIADFSAYLNPLSYL